MYDHIVWYRNSDHRLVVARMDVKWPKVYKKRTKTEAQKRFDTGELVTNAEKQSEYKHQNTTANNKQTISGIIKKQQMGKIKEYNNINTRKVIGFKKNSTKQ